MGVVRRDGLVVTKSTCIADYTRLMGGVDLSDQLDQYYTLIRHTIKWWKKLFFHLLNLLIVNAYIMCNKYGPEMTHFQLRLALIKGLLEETPNIEIDSKSESDSRPTPAPQNRPGPGGDGWNDEDDGPRAIGKKLRIEETRTRW